MAVCERVGWLCGLLSQTADAIWAETGPVFAIDLDDWRLEMSESENIITCFIVHADIDEGVVQPGLVEGLGGEVALHAGWLGVHGDGHGMPFFNSLRPH